MKHFFSVALLLLLVSPIYAGKFQEKCPCGPDAIKGPVRLLLKQGSKGGDFRFSCRKHDACYVRLDSTQKNCDDAFLKHLLAECEKNSRNPKKCGRNARFAYWLVRKFGGGPYRLSQRLSVRKPR